jgi:lysozyme
MIAPYLDRLAKPNVWTRGYGRTYGITQDSPSITVDEAKQELGIGLEQYGLACTRLAPALIGRPKCLAAVASRAWNCGIGAFKVSRLRKAINEDRWEDAAELMLKPDTAGGVVYRGLQRRRVAEAVMFRAGI